MHSVGADCQCHIAAGIDQQASFAVRSANLFERCLRQSLKISCRQVFFAQLDEIDSRSGGFRNAIQQSRGAIAFAAGKLRAIGDVVEKQASD